MSLIRAVISAMAIILAGTAIPSSLHSQVSRADSATVLLRVAQRLEADGETGMARDVLAVLLHYYPDTRAANAAADWLTDLRTVRTRGNGRTGLTVWNTIYGAWLGVAVPTALGATEPAPYGAGLLIGAPLGFFGTRALTQNKSVTSGQAISTAFGSIWGTFQGIGWREVFDIGDTESCWYDEYVGQEYCYESTPEEAPFTAAVIGGLAGLATGAAVSAATDPSAGTATMVQFGALWGTWYGIAAGVLAGAEDEALLAWSLVGGNVGLLGTALSTSSWEMTAGQAWLVTAAGLAGGVAGLGVTFLFNVENAEAGVGITAAGTTAGLVTGLVIVARNGSSRLESDQFIGGGALVNLDGSNWSLGLPIPQPALLRRADSPGSTRTAIGMRVPLLAGTF